MIYGIFPKKFVEKFEGIGPRLPVLVEYMAKNRDSTFAKRGRTILEQHQCTR